MSSTSDRSCTDWRRVNPMVRYANFYNCLPGERIGPRFIYDFQLLLIQDGQGELRIDNRLYSASTGDVFFYGPGQQHQIVSAESRTLRLLGIHFVFEDCDWDEVSSKGLWNARWDPAGPLPRCPLRPAPPSKSTPGPEVFRLAQHIVLSFSIHSYQQAVRQRGLLLLFLAEWQADPAGAGATRGTLSSVDIQSIRWAQALLHAEFRALVSRDEIAERVGLSPAYFSRLFKRVTGVTFQDYLIQLRLSRAQQLLLEGRLQVAEVASESGFRDPYYFSRLFHRRVGCCPSEYQRGSWPEQH